MERNYAGPKKARPDLATSLPISHREKMKKHWKRDKLGRLVPVKQWSPHNEL